MRWHIMDAYRWKCAHWCRFPFVQHCAPVPSVTSHWFPCPNTPPYGHSSQCQSNADSGPRSFMVIFSLCVCVCVCIHACVFLFWGTCFFFVFFLTFPFRRSRRYEGVSLQWQGRDGASRQRGVGRSQEELSSSNRQRAKRMTVPSSSLSVNMIMFEPSLRSKACHTACKTVTKGVK